MHMTHFITSVIGKHKTNFILTKYYEVSFLTSHHHCQKSYETEANSSCILWVQTLVFTCHRELIKCFSDKIMDNTYSW